MGSESPPPLQKIAGKWGTAGGVKNHICLTSSSAPCHPFMTTTGYRLLGSFGLIQGSLAFGKLERQSERFRNLILMLTLKTVKWSKKGCLLFLESCSTPSLAYGLKQVARLIYIVHDGIDD